MYRQSYRGECVPADSCRLSLHYYIYRRTTIGRASPTTHAAYLPIHYHINSSNIIYRVTSLSLLCTIILFLPPASLAMPAAGAVVDLMFAAHLVHSMFEYVAVCCISECGIISLSMDSMPPAPLPH